MLSVNISELKARLTKYLKFVRKGEIITVLDRHTPIAKIVAIQSSEHGLLARRKPLADCTELAQLFRENKRLPGRETDSLAVLLQDRSSR